MISKVEILQRAEELQLVLGEVLQLSPSKRGDDLPRVLDAKRGGIALRHLAYRGGI